MTETAYNKLLSLIKTKKYKRKLPYIEIMTALNIRFATLKTYKDELNRTLGLKGKNKYKVVRTLSDTNKIQDFSKMYSDEFDTKVKDFESSLYNFYLGKTSLKQLQTDLINIFESVDYHQLRLSYNLDRLIYESNEENDKYTFTILLHLRETLEKVYNFNLSSSKVKAREFLYELLLLGDNFSYKSLQFKYNVLGYVPSAVILEKEQSLFKTNQTRIRNSYVDYEVLGTFYDSLVLFYGQPILVVSERKYNKLPRPHIATIESSSDTEED